MSTFVISFIVMILCVAGLAIGVLLGRAPLSGSCGGLNNCACARPCARQRAIRERLGSGG